MPRGPGDAVQPGVGSWKRASPSCHLGIQYYLIINCSCWPTALVDTELYTCAPPSSPSPPSPHTLPSPHLPRPPHLPHVGSCRYTSEAVWHTRSKIRVMWTIASMRWYVFQISTMFSIQQFLTSVTPRQNPGQNAAWEGQGARAFDSAEDRERLRTQETA